MLQIVRHLTLYIFLTQIRLNFSTSISTSPATYTVRSPVTSPNTSPTIYDRSAPKLNGYALIVYSRDPSCSNPYYATTSILNSCYRSYDNMSRLVYATSSTVVERAFIDLQCAIPAGAMISSYTEGKCNSSEVYIGSSVVRNSEIGGVTIR